MFAPFELHRRVNLWGRRQNVKAIPTTFAPPWAHRQNRPQVPSSETFRNLRLFRDRGSDPASGRVQTRCHAAIGKYGKSFPGELVKRTRAMLSALDAAVVVEDLRFPPGNHLEELKGDRTGQHSVRINRQWRVCLVWTPNGPADVETVD